MPSMIGTEYRGIFRKMGKMVRGKERWGRKKDGESRLGHGRVLKL